MVPEFGEDLLQTGELAGVTRNDGSETRLSRGVFLLLSCLYCRARGVRGRMGEAQNGRFWIDFIGVRKFRFVVIPPRRRCAPPQRGMKTGASGANMSAAGGT